MKNRTKFKKRSYCTREPRLGYYLIITDGYETEKNYFEGLKNSLPNGIKDKLVISVVTKKTSDLISECRKQVTYNAQFRKVWLVFDKDRIINFDQITEKAKSEGINVGWSNPCFEIWLYAYLDNMIPAIDSRTCCSKFGDKYKIISKKEYKKNDKDIYKHINEYGDERQAIFTSKKRYEQHIESGINKPSEMIPCNTVYQLIEEIKKKTGEDDSK